MLRIHSTLTQTTLNSKFALKKKTTYSQIFQVVVYCLPFLSPVGFFLVPLVFVYIHSDYIDLTMQKTKHNIFTYSLNKRQFFRGDIVHTTSQHGLYVLSGGAIRRGVGWGSSLLPH